MIWKIWTKSKLKCEMIWKMWTKSKLKCEMIWKMWNKSKLKSEKKKYGKYRNKGQVE